MGTAKMNESITPNELRKHFPGASADTLARNTPTGGVASGPERAPDPGHEPVGAVAPEIARPNRRLVRVTSYRVRLCDERNLFEKHFVDALVRAKLLVNDSAQFAHIQVEQKQVEHGWEECTVLEISDLAVDSPPAPMGQSPK